MPPNWVLVLGRWYISHAFLPPCGHERRSTCLRRPKMLNHLLCDQAWFAVSVCLLGAAFVKAYVWATVLYACSCPRLIPTLPTLCPRPLHTLFAPPTTMHGRVHVPPCPCARPRTLLLSTHLVHILLPAFPSFTGARSRAQKSLGPCPCACVPPRLPPFTS
jgi:hypothetical protein